MTKGLSTRVRSRVLAATQRGPTDAQPVEEGSRSQPLRNLAIRGGAYLVGRSAIGMVIRLAGLIVTLRLIGPSAYGIFTGAAAFTLVITAVAQMGGEIYLIKMPDTPSLDDYDRVFTFILASSIVATGVAEAITFAFGDLFRPEGVLLPLRVLLLCVPINVLWAPSQARIERDFGYRKMGILELGGDVALYGTAVPLAYLGEGAWSLVVGYFVWQSWLLIGSFAYSGLRPRLRWSNATARELAKFGFSYSLAIWIGLLSGLVNPLVVGRFFGASGVGYVGFAQRLVTTIGFAQTGAYRLGLVALSRVPNEHKDRLRRALEEGSEFQLLALAVPFALFGVVARKVIPVLFGHEWIPAIRVYTLLALALVLGACGFIQIVLLLSRGRNLTVAAAAGLQFAILAVASAFLVRHFGIDGFGYASLAVLVVLIYLDRKARSIVGFSYRKCLVVALVVAPMVAYPLLSFPLSLVMFAPLAVFISVPFTRREGLREIATIKSAFSGRNIEAKPDEGPMPDEGPVPDRSID